MFPEVDIKSIVSHEVSTGFKKNYKSIYII